MKKIIFLFLAATIPLCAELIDVQPDGGGAHRDVWGAPQQKVPTPDQIGIDDGPRRALFALSSKGPVKKVVIYPKMRS